MKSCFLCDKKGNVLDFNDASFKKCSLMLLFRRKKKFKYHDILLTIESTDASGYHTECLKKITVLKQKDKEEFENFCETQTVSKILIALKNIIGYSYDINNTVLTSRFFCKKLFF